MRNNWPNVLPMNGKNKSLSPIHNAQSAVSGERTRLARNIRRPRRMTNEHLRLALSSEVSGGPPETAREPRALHGISDRFQRALQVIDQITDVLNADR